MLHDSGDTVNSPALAHDIEARLDALQREADQLRRQIEQSQRLAALGTMSAMLAHEFNNNLTPIISYAQYARDKGDADLMRTALDRTLKSARRLSELCGKLLGMASPAQMGPRAAALRPVIVEAIDCLGRSLEKDNIELALDVPEALSARFHAASLEQVLFNLVLNARQAMLDRPGRLVISARPANPGSIQILISDTGCGIKPDDLTRIFEPFFTTKQHESRPDRGGIGLGLATCKQLMRDQSGDITVESTPGRGTTFTLTLPAE